MGYPTAAELVALSSDGNLVELTDDVKGRLYGSAIATIERYCNQSFTQEGSTLAPVVKVLRGSGSDTLWLPRRLVALDSIVVLGTGLSLGDVAVSPDGARIYLPAMSVGSSWLLRAQARLSGGYQRVFPEGEGAVSVGGVWGWLDAEWDDWQTNGALAPVARAILYDMEESADAEASGMHATVRAARTLGLKSVTEGTLTVTPGSTPILSVRARRELDDRFIWRGQIGGVV